MGPISLLSLLFLEIHSCKINYWFALFVLIVDYWYSSWAFQSLISSAIGRFRKDQVISWDIDRRILFDYHSEFVPFDFNTSGWCRWWGIIRMKLLFIYDIYKTTSFLRLWLGHCVFVPHFKKETFDIEVHSLQFFRLRIWVSSNVFCLDWGFLGLLLLLQIIVWHSPLMRGLLIWHGL